MNINDKNVSIIIFGANIRFIIDYRSGYKSIKS